LKRQDTFYPIFFFFQSFHAPRLPRPHTFFSYPFFVETNPRGGTVSCETRIRHLHSGPLTVFTLLPGPPYGHKFSPHLKLFFWAPSVFSPPPPQTFFLFIFLFFDFVELLFMVDHSDFGRPPFFSVVSRKFCVTEDVCAPASFGRALFFFFRSVPPPPLCLGVFFSLPSFRLTFHGGTCYAHPFCSPLFPALLFAG